MNNELMMYSAGRTEQQQLLPDLQQKKTTMLSRYGDRVAMLNRYSPDKQITLCADDRVAILDDSPTLTDLKLTYGRNTAVMFLIPQLLNISEFCGARDKFTDRQIEETAQLIAANYPWLKVLEIMTFCKKFKMGHYGRFYGSVDPMVITSALREFLEYRKEIYGDYEQFLAQKRIEEEKKKPHIPFDEWKRQKEARGEKVNFDMSVVEKRGREQRVINPIESALESAKNLVINKYNLSMKSLLEMRAVFRDNNGMTPEEFIEKAEKKEL